jgi:hypothetical protein
VACRNAIPHTCSQAMMRMGPEPSAVTCVRAIVIKGSVKSLVTFWDFHTALSIWVCHFTAQLSEILVAIGFRR